MTRYFRPQQAQECKCRPPAPTQFNQSINQTCVSASKSWPESRQTLRPLIASLATPSPQQLDWCTCRQTSTFQTQSSEHSSGPHAMMYVLSGLHARYDTPYAWPSNMWRRSTVWVSCPHNDTTHGDVDQWLGRRSLAGGISLIYGWLVTTSWGKCPLWVNQPGNLVFHPFRVGKWVEIHYWVETIKRQPGVWMAVGYRSKSVGASLANGQ